GTVGRGPNRPQGPAAAGESSRQAMGSAVARLEVEGQGALEHALEAAVRKRLGAQDRRFQRALAGLVIGATRLDLDLDHLAARQLADLHPAALAQRDRLRTQPLVDHRLLDGRRVLGSQVLAGATLPRRTLAGRRSGRSLLGLLQLAQLLLGQLGLAGSLLALAAQLGQLLLALGLLGLGRQPALVLRLLLPLLLGQVDLLLAAALFLFLFGLFPGDGIAAGLVLVDRVRLRDEVLGLLLRGDRGVLRTRLGQRLRRRDGFLGGGLGDRLGQRLGLGRFLGAALGGGDVGRAHYQRSLDRRGPGRRFDMALRRPPPGQPEHGRDQYVQDQGQQQRAGQAAVAVVGSVVVTV